MTGPRIHVAPDGVFVEVSSLLETLAPGQRWRHVRVREYGPHYTLCGAPAGDQLAAGILAEACPECAGKVAASYDEFVSHGRARVVIAGQGEVDLILHEPSSN